MPQAAITAVGAFIASVGVSQVVATFVAKVFVYAAASYLLNRAATALPTDGVRYYAGAGRIALGRIHASHP